jgi:acetyl-CoA carboxylase carboxyl transferase subunit alpha
LVDELVPEPPPGAHAFPEVAIGALRGALMRHLDEIIDVDRDTLVAQRMQRYREAGG